MLLNKTVTCHFAFVSFHQLYHLVYKATGGFINFEPFLWGEGGEKGLTGRLITGSNSTLNQQKNVRQQQLLFVYPSVIYIYIIEYVALYFIFIYYTLFLQEQFYNNNEAQICPKVKNKRKQLRLGLDSNVTESFY